MTTTRLIGPAALKPCLTPQESVLAGPFVCKVFTGTGELGAAPWSPLISDAETAGLACLVIDRGRKATELRCYLSKTAGESLSVRNNPLVIAELYLPTIKLLTLAPNFLALEVGGASGAVSQAMLGVQFATEDDATSFRKAVDQYKPRPEAFNLKASSSPAAGAAGVAPLPPASAPGRQPAHQARTSAMHALTTGGSSSEVAGVGGQPQVLSQSNPPQHQQPARSRRSSAGSTGGLVGSITSLFGGSARRSSAASDVSGRSGAENRRPQEMVIGGVVEGSFKHEGHVGVTSEGGFDVSKIPREWKETFKALGISKHDLKHDPELAKSLCSVMAEAEADHKQGTNSNGHQPSSSSSSFLQVSTMAMSSAAIPTAVAPTTSAGPAPLSPKSGGTGNINIVSVGPGMPVSAGLAPAKKKLAPAPPPQQTAQPTQAAPIPPAPVEPLGAQAPPPLPPRKFLGVTVGGAGTVTGPSAPSTSSVPVQVAGVAETKPPATKVDVAPLVQQPQLQAPPPIPAKGKAGLTPRTGESPGAAGATPPSAVALAAPSPAPAAAPPLAAAAAAALTKTVAAAPKPAPIVQPPASAVAAAAGAGGSPALAGPAGAPMKPMALLAGIKGFDKRKLSSVEVGEGDSAGPTAAAFPPKPAVAAARPASASSAGAAVAPLAAPAGGGGGISGMAAAAAAQMAARRQQQQQAVATGEPSPALANASMQAAAVASPAPFRVPMAAAAAAVSSSPALQARPQAALAAATSAAPVSGTVMRSKAAPPVPQSVPQQAQVQPQPAPQIQTQPPPSMPRLSPPTAPAPVPVAAAVVAPTRSMPGGIPSTAGAAAGAGGSPAIAGPAGAPMKPMALLAGIKGFDKSKLQSVDAGTSDSTSGGSGRGAAASSVGAGAARASAPSSSAGGGAGQPMSMMDQLRMMVEAKRRSISGAGASAPGKPPAKTAAAADDDDTDSEWSTD